MQANNNIDSVTFGITGSLFDTRQSCLPGSVGHSLSVFDALPPVVASLSFLEHSPVLSCDETHWLVAVRPVLCQHSEVLPLWFSLSLPVGKLILRTFTYTQTQKPHYHLP